jgi:hypothetical protein
MKSASGGAVARALCGFWDRWTGAILPAEEQPEAQGIFQALVGRTFPQSDGSRPRSNLCSDGTPIELSLALDNFGRFAVRFVCDAVYEDLEDAQLRRALRDCGSLTVSPQWPCWPILDSLYERHLEDSPRSSRFKMWHGAGFAPGAPRMAKLYFNTEWRSREEILEILAGFLAADDLGELSDSAFLWSGSRAGVGYDFDASGTRKVKAYVRLPEFRLDAILREAEKHCSTQYASFSELSKLVAGWRPFPGASNCVVSLGFLPRHRFHEFKVYIPVQVWGVHDFPALGPVMEKVLQRWNLGSGFALTSPGPAGFAPTLLSFGVDDSREMMSLYFKPELPSQLLEPTGRISNAAAQ